MLNPLALHASDEIRAALAGMGRTEDVAFSPDNRRMAIAGFADHNVVVLDLDIRFDPDPQITITGFTEIQAPILRQPHGLAFIDDDLLVVANRKGILPIFRMLPPVVGVRREQMLPLMEIGADDPEHINTPGSVTVVPLADNLVDVLVCNNYVRRITRHVVDTMANRVVATDVAVATGLAVPDGIAVSNDRRWVAISNHNAQSVLLFADDHRLDAATPAVGALHGVHFPHGLRFTADDAHLLVADSGEPVVQVFARTADGWHGQREPVAAITVMADDEYRRGRTNFQEGGPKGLELDRTGRVMALSWEGHPVEFFDLAAVPGVPLVGERAVDRAAAQQHVVRTAVLRGQERAAVAAERLATAEEQIKERDTKIGVLESWVKGLLRRQP